MADWQAVAERGRMAATMAPISNMQEYFYTSLYIYISTHTLLLLVDSVVEFMRRVVDIYELATS